MTAALLLKLLGAGLAVILVVTAGLWLALARPSLFPSAAAPPGPRPDAARLREHVEVLSQQLVPRSYRHPEVLDRVAGYIASAFREAGARVGEQVFETDGRTYRNVTGEFGPESGAVVIVGAHYDTAGELPGADDNASGVAGLLEIARLLGRSPPRGRVRLVAFTLEEPPYFATPMMGSAVYAQALERRSEAVTLMIGLEMIGYYSERAGSQHYPLPLLRLFYPSAGNFIAVVDQLFSAQGQRLKRWINAATAIPAYSINAPSFVPGVDLSDHRNFWRYGYPAVMVTDTAFFRNDAYHTSRDTAERLDYARMAEVVSGVLSYARHVAGRP